jgi:membrane protein required for colicin V production
MDSLLEFIQNNISTFDLIVFLITIYSMIQSAAKGFTLSLLSFSKWLLALIITIILVPKLNPWIQDYIDSKFVADIGLGIFIYIVSLFVLINIGKVIGRVVTWTGLGAVDKTFGLIFGIFKGYVFCVCVFSLLNWFYPHQNWPVKTEGTYSFKMVYKGSELLIEGFPKSDEYYDDTKEKIEKI